MSNSIVDYLQLVRAPAVFTALSNILAAHLIAANGLVQWSGLIVLLFASATLYMSGMVLNDCFDYAEDSRDRSSRPLPSGRIKLEKAWRLGWSLMLFGLLITGLLGLRSFLIGLTLSALIVFYNAYAKKSKLGTVVMGSCRYFNWLLGLSIVPLRIDFLFLPLPVMIYVGSLTLLSTVETSAERKQYVLYTSFGMLVCAGVILSIQSTFQSYLGLGGIALVVALACLLMRLRITFQNFNTSEIQKTIKFLVMGIIPLDALIVLSCTSFLNAIVILSLLFPGAFLARSMRVT